MQKHVKYANGNAICILLQQLHFRLHFSVHISFFHTQFCIIVYMFLHFCYQFLHLYMCIFAFLLGKTVFVRFRTQPRLSLVVDLKKHHPKMQPQMQLGSTGVKPQNATVHFFAFRVCIFLIAIFAFSIILRIRTSPWSTPVTMPFPARSSFCAVLSKNQPTL